MARTQRNGSAVVPWPAPRWPAPRHPTPRACPPPCQPLVSRRRRRKRLVLDGHLTAARSCDNGRRPGLLLLRDAWTTGTVRIKTIVRDRHRSRRRLVVRGLRLPTCRLRPLLEGRGPPCESSVRSRAVIGLVKVGMVLQLALASRFEDCVVGGTPNVSGLCAVWQPTAFDRRTVDAACGRR